MNGLTPFVGSVKSIPSSSSSSAFFRSYFYFVTFYLVGFSVSSFFDGLGANDLPLDFLLGMSSFTFRYEKLSVSVTVSESKPDVFCSATADLDLGYFLAGFGVAFFTCLVYSFFSSLVSSFFSSSACLVTFAYFCIAVFGVDYEA